MHSIQLLDPLLHINYFTLDLHLAAVVRVANDDRCCLDCEEISSLDFREVKRSNVLIKLLIQITKLR